MKKILSLLLFAGLVFNGSLSCAAAADQPNTVVSDMELEEEDHGGILTAQSPDRPKKRKSADTKFDEDDSQRRKGARHSESQHRPDLYLSLPVNEDGEYKDASIKDKSKFINHCRKGNLDHVMSYLAEGMNPNYTIGYKFKTGKHTGLESEFSDRFQSGDHLVVTPLIVAINYGYTNIVAALLKAGAKTDMNVHILERDEEIFPLAIAAQRGFSTISELLVSQGAHPSKGLIRLEREEYDLPEDIALDNGHTELARNLKEKCELIKKFHTACRVDDTYEFKRLLEAGANHSFALIDYYTKDKAIIETYPLGVASTECNMYIAEKLIKSGADMHKGYKDSYQSYYTPLELLTEKLEVDKVEKLKLAKLLLSSGAHPDKGYEAKGDEVEKTSPLKYSLEEIPEDIDPEFVALLLEHGASQQFVSREFKYSLPKDLQLQLRWAQWKKVKDKSLRA